MPSVSSKKKKAQVYIVPTRFGLLYGALTLLLFGTGVSFNNTSVIYISGVFVMLGLMCMYQTHLNILSVDFRGIEVASGFSKQSVHWKMLFSNKSNLACYSIYALNSLIDIPARSETAESVSVALGKRGKTSLKQIKLSSTYPLGLFYSWKVIKVEEEYFVYPELLKEVEMTHNSPRRENDLDDFSGFKTHGEGQSLKHIDWKTYARTEKLLLKQFESQSSDGCLLQWYEIPGLDLEEKLKFAATVVEECAKDGKPVGLLFPQTHVPLDAGASHYRRCLEELAEIKIA